MGKFSCTAAGAVACCLLLAASAIAQDVLPRPEQQFQGAIGRTTAETAPPQWPKPVEAPKGAPNVLVILTDDVGFGASSTFGGPIPTPTLEMLAKMNRPLCQCGSTWPRQPYT